MKNFVKGCQYVRKLSKVISTALSASAGHLRPSPKTVPGHEFLFEYSPAAQILLNSDLRIVKWNRSAETLFGFSRSEVMEKEMIKLIVPSSDRGHLTSVFNKTLQQGTSISRNYSITKAKEEFFSEWLIARVEEGPYQDHCICIVQDTTKTKKALDDLNKRSTALESSGEAILYTNHKGIIEFANRNFFVLFKSFKEEIFNYHLGEFLFGSISGMNAILPQFDTDNTWKGSIVKSCAGGEKVFSVVITAIYNTPSLVSYIANLHDITELSSHLHSLTRQAHQDPLTGAANRSAMDAALIRAFHHAERRETKIALFFIDLNDFKLVNDKYGHETGDKLLAGISANLRSCLRNSDTISRYGGDEFVVIIEEIKNQEHIATILHTIQAAISEPILIGTDTYITPKASIGTALYPDDAATPDALIKAADTSMYTIKKSKKSPSSLSIEPEPEPFADSHSR